MEGTHSRVRAAAFAIDARIVEPKVDEPIERMRRALRLDRIDLAAMLLEPWESGEVAVRRARRWLDALDPSRRRELIAILG